MGRLTQQLETKQGRLSLNQEPDETGLVQDIGEDITKRGETLGTQIERISGRDKDLGISDIPEIALNIAGQGVGAGFDIGGRILSKVTPEFIKQPISKIVQNITGIKPIQLTVEKYKEWKVKNPRIATDLESAVNIASLIPIGTAGKVSVKAGEVIEKVGLKAIEAEKQSFARRLIRPIETKKIREAEVRRTTETGFGPFKKSVIEPTAFEAKSQEAILKVPGISNRKTYQQNYNVISDYNINLAKKLERDIKANDFIFPKKELIARLNTTKESLMNNPILVGDAAKTSDKLIAEINRRINQTGAKGSSLLQVRKDYDQWVLSQKPKVFDPISENAFTIANREIRNTINGFLHEKAPNVGIKDSLAEQTSLYNALDNIQPKAALEANTAIGRSFQRMMLAIGLKNKIVQQIAALVGIGGLGAAATFAPTAAVTGIGIFITYKGTKLMLKPELRTLLGRLLQEYETVAGTAAVTSIKEELNNYSQ